MIQYLRLRKAMGSASNGAIAAELGNRFGNHFDQYAATELQIINIAVILA